MKTYFMDSSAAVKGYVEEAGSEQVGRLLEPSEDREVYISRVGPVEIAAALFRKVKAGELDREDARLAMEQLRSDLDSLYQVVEVGAFVADRAMEMAERHGLRGYDCLQLACAVILKEKRAAVGLTPLVLVSADGELNQAAEQEAIAVEYPSSE